MQQKLTDTKIRNAKPQGKLIKLSDGGSLFVHIQPNGTKRFVMAYRFEGKQRSFSIGVYPDVSLTEARQMRNEARELLSEGVDPNRAKQRKTLSNSDMTFFTQAERWFAFYRVDKSEGTVNRNWRLLELYVFPSIGDREIGAISRLELVEIVERVASSGAYENAKKVASVITMVMNSAVNRGVIDLSVAQRLGSVVPSRKVSGHAAITDPQSLGVLLQAIKSDKSLTDSVYYALRILPYVFVRNSELRCAKWDEFNLDVGEWIIPAERMKMRKAHLVPLATQVVSLLRKLKGRGLSQTLLFPSPVSRTKPISDNTLRVALLRFGYSRNQVSVHGFRKTASTLLHEQGFDSILIERQLAHTDRNTVRAIYNYAEYKTERAAMMQSWANYLDSLHD